MYLSPPPDLFLFAQSLRQSVKNDSAINRARAFALGLSYGLKVKTLAGMADCSKTHVRRMLLLLDLPTHDVIAISEGAPYSPLIRHHRTGGRMPEVQSPESIHPPTGC